MTAFPPSIYFNTPSPVASYAALNVEADQGTAPISSVVILITYPSGVTEPVYGPTSSFWSLYTGSTVTSGGGVTTFNIVRIGGFPSNPTMTIAAYATDGLSTIATNTWQLIQAAPSPVTGFAVPTGATALYGSDLRTFLNMGLGPDLDPYMLIVTDPRVVMPEQLARRLTMGPGTLWYDPTAGFDLRPLINQALATGNTASIQTAITNQCLADERVASVSVGVTQPDNSSLDISIAGVGAAGPFGIVLNVSALGLQNLTFTG